MTSRRTAQRLSRILAMLPWVIAHPGAAVDEVCERFGYTRSELIGDLNLIFLCGLPGYGPGDLIDAEVEDDEVWVDMADYFSRPSRLTPAEALTLLAAGMALVSSGHGSPALERAVDKLAAVVAPPDEAALAIDLAATPEFVAELERAVREGRVCELTYTGLASGRTTTRAVEPWTVFSTLGNWYLSAYCRLAGGERVFRVDRIRRVEVTDERFQPPAQPPPPEVRYTPGEDDVRVTIRLQPPARWVADYYPVEDVGDGVIRFSASDPAVVARLLLRLGPDAALVEGDEVAELVADYRRRVRRRYHAR